MDSYEPGDVCGIGNCDSSLWINNGDGTQSCENGHIRERYEDDNDEEFDNHGEKTTMKKDRIQRQDLRPVGRQQNNLVVLCHQWILWKQVRWLTEKRHLPEEFERLVRELWEVRLNNLSEKIDHGFTSEYQAGPGNDDTANEKHGTHNLIRLSDLPALKESIALCYMGVYLLRLPIFIGDLLKWIKRKELLYINAISALPRAMRDRLRRTSLLVDGKQAAPMDIHDATQELILAYQNQSSIILPPLNVPPLLFRLIDELAMPIEAYAVVKKMIANLAWSFSYSQLGPKKSAWKLSTPERKLAGLFVVMIKIIYPLDDMLRLPVTDTEVGARTVDWVRWESERYPQTDDQTQSSRQQAHAATESDVLGMSDDKIDQYMDWFEETWVQEHNVLVGGQDDFLASLEQAFPTEHIPRNLNYSQPLDRHERVTRRSGTTQSAMIAQPNNQNDITSAEGNPGIKPSGFWYTRRRSADDLVGTELKLYTAVANIAGLSVEALVDTTFFVDMQLERYMARKRAEAAQKGVS